MANFGLGGAHVPHMPRSSAVTKGLADPALRGEEGVIRGGLF